MSIKQSLLNQLLLLALLWGVAQQGHANLPDPSTLRGVHWKTYTIPTFDNTGKLASAEIIAKPNNVLSDYDKIAYFASWGLNLIAFKLEDGGQMTTEFPGGEDGDDKTIWNGLTTAEKQILETARAEGATRFVKAANDWNQANPDKKVYILLFTRKWLMNNGKENVGGIADGARIFADVINRCVAQGTDGALYGVHPVENRIDGMDNLMDYCLRFADAVNAQTNNWLKNKAYYFAGLSMGISFRGYRANNKLTVASILDCKGSDTFWNDIQSRCGAFSWVSKYYPKWDIEPSFKKYNTLFTGDPKESYEKALQQILIHFGHLPLKEFVAKAPNEMYNNVLFWGDASDGIRHLPNSVRDAYKAIWTNYGFGSANFYHFFNINATYPSVWNDENNIAWLDNGVLKQNKPFGLYSKFFDGDLWSTYGSTNYLQIPDDIEGENPEPPTAVTPVDLPFVDKFQAYNNDAGKLGGTSIQFNRLSDYPGWEVQQWASASNNNDRFSFFRSWEDTPQTEGFLKTPPVNFVGQPTVLEFSGRMIVNDIGSDVSTKGVNNLPRNIYAVLCNGDTIYNHRKANLEDASQNLPFFQNLNRFSSTFFYDGTEQVKFTSAVGDNLNVASAWFNKSDGLAIGPGAATTSGDYSTRPGIAITSTALPTINIPYGRRVDLGEFTSGDSYQTDIPLYGFNIESSHKIVVSSSSNRVSFDQTEFYATAEGKISDNIIAYLEIGNRAPGTYFERISVRLYNALDGTIDNTLRERWFWLSYEVVESPSSVLRPSATSFKVVRESNGVRIEAPIGSAIQVYNLVGGVVVTSVQTSDSHYLPLQKGIYLLRVGDEQIKIAL